MEQDDSRDSADEAVMAGAARGARPAYSARLVLGASVGWLGISMTADAVPTLLLPYRLSTAGSDAASLGLITLAAIALAALVQPYAGRWSDVRGRFPTLAIGVAVTGAGLALVAAPLAPEAALAGAVLALVGASIAQAGQQALLPDVVAASRRGLASGAKNAFDVGGALLGFLVLAVLLGAGDLAASAAVLLAVLVGGVVAAYVLVGRYQRPPLKAPIAANRAPVMSISRAEHGQLLHLIVARFVFLLGVYVVGRFLFLFAAERWRLTPDQAAAQVGLVLVLLAGVTVLSSMPAGWLADRLGRRGPMVAGGVLAGSGIALLPLASTLEVLIGAGVLLAVGSALFSAGSWARLSDLVAEADSGRLLGLAHIGTAGAAALAGLFGLLIDAGERLGALTGYNLAFLLAATCAATGGLLAGRAASSGQRRFTSSAVHAERGV